MTIRLTNDISIKEDFGLDTHRRELEFFFKTVHKYSSGNKNRLVFTIKMSTNVGRRFVLNYKDSELQSVTYTDIHSIYPDCYRGKYIYIRSFWSRMVHTQGYI